MSEKTLEIGTDLLPKLTEILGYEWTAKEIERTSALYLKIKCNTMFFSYILTSFWSDL